MKIKLDEGAIMPQRAHPTDAGLDLFTPSDVSILPVSPYKADENSYGYSLAPYICAAVDTGVHVEIPHGYYGKIESKSGLNRNHQIVCCGGVIDEGYTGSIVVILYNLGSAPYSFKAGEKIAQLVIQPYASPEFELVEELGETDRGDAGFGSTGK